jgi:hypothetical protein
MKKYGFIYLWFDKKYKRFYIGRHWGTDTDGYICSSNPMRDAYRRRPEDFKRRILKRIYTSNEDLVLEEQRWLDMIDPSECSNKYYNKTLRSSTPSTRGYNHTPETIAKIKSSNSGRKLTDEHKEKLRQAKLGSVGNRTGKKSSEETRRRISEAQKGNTYSKGRIPWNKGLNHTLPVQ